MGTGEVLPRRHYLDAESDPGGGTDAGQNPTSPLGREAGLKILGCSFFFSSSKQSSRRRIQEQSENI